MPGTIDPVWSGTSGSGVITSLVYSSLTGWLARPLSSMIAGVLIVSGVMFSAFGVVSTSTSRVLGSVSLLISLSTLRSGAVEATISTIISTSPVLPGLKPITILISIGLTRRPGTLTRKQPRGISSLAISSFMDPEARPSFRMSS